MASFTAIVVSHANPTGLRKVLDCLCGQTIPPTQILVFLSGYSDTQLSLLRMKYPEADFTETEFRNDWGHYNRARGLEQATQEYVGFFSDDCWWEPTYIEKMLAPGDDITYCGWNEEPDCDFSLGHSDAGNFIVKREIGQRVGWPDTPVHANDGYFIEQLKNHTKSISKVDEVLAHHNWQPC